MARTSMSGKPGLSFHVQTHIAGAMRFAPPRPESGTRRGSVTSLAVLQRPQQTCRGKTCHNHQQGGGCLWCRRHQDNKRAFEQTGHAHQGKGFGGCVVALATKC